MVSYQNNSIVDPLSLNKKDHSFSNKINGQILENVNNNNTNNIKKK